MKSLWLGQLTYPDGLKTQDGHHHSVCADSSHPGVVLGLEHTPTITLGKRGSRHEDLNREVSELESSGWRVCESDRGGQATLHGPGQLVIYPLVPLRRYGLGARSYVGALEQTTARFLTQLGVPGVRSGDEPGLYSSVGKIAFLGVRISRGVSSHGIAINVRNKLTDFSLIRSCGVSSERFDRLCNHAVDAPLSELLEVWTESFAETLSLTKSAQTDYGRHSSSRSGGAVGSAFP